MTIELLDVVKVAKDVPELNLKSGMEGTVIEVFHDPELAYEVEFCDSLGRTITQTALLPSQLIKIDNSWKLKSKHNISS